MIRATVSRGILALALLLAPCGPAPAQTTGGPEVEIPPGMRVPAVSLSAVQDSVSGWNLFAEVSGFRFAPESAGEVLRPGEGHAFVYVDGVEIARVYTPAYHLDRLEPGMHEIKYALHANDHSRYVRHGEEIADSVTIEVPVPPREAERRPPYVSPTAIPAGEARPAVALEVSADPHSGWNLNATVSGFDFAPEQAGGENLPGQGHAELYVDGQRVARLYGRAFHLRDLGPGTHRIQVNLVGNDHAPFVHRGEAIAATVRIDVPAGPPAR